MAILLISLLSISAVSAADDTAIDESVLEEGITDADLTGIQNDELEQGDENALIEEGETPPPAPITPSFNLLSDKIVNGGDEVNLTEDYFYQPMTESHFQKGINITRNVTINGNGHSIDGKNQARIFYVYPDCNVTFKDIVFINGKVTDEEGDMGGAVLTNETAICTAINCSFINNTAANGGAMVGGEAINCTFLHNTATTDCGAFAGDEAINCTFINNTATKICGAFGKGNATNCTFIENTANEGGAMVYGSAINCTFKKNVAFYRGGAIYNGNASNCNFTQNVAASEGGAIRNGNANNCTFIRNSASQGGAIYYGNAINCNFTENYAIGGEFAWGGAISEGNANNCNFFKNTAPYAGAMGNGEAINCTFIENNAELWGGATIGVNVNNSTFIQNSAKYAGALAQGNITNCTFMLNHAEVGNDAVGAMTKDCRFIVPVFTASDLNTVYNSAEKFLFTLEADGQVLDGVNTIISIYKGSAFVANYSALSGEGWTVNLPAGTYKAVLSVEGSDVEPVTKTITVAKNPTAITASAVTATYNVNKYLIIKLTDGNGKALSGVKVTVTLGTAKEYTTDKNGQIKINVAKLAPKTYTAKIAYAGNANYAAANKNVKVVVKKATPKMTAKAKSFKVALKTKKYTVTLKDNKGKVMKNTKLSLTVNKKTYTVKTNSKGVATFKITNLKKKGKFTATIKFAGNKYYNKLTKKAKITIK